MESRDQHPGFSLLMTSYRRLTCLLNGESHLFFLVFQKVFQIVFVLFRQPDSDILRSHLRQVLNTIGRSKKSRNHLARLRRLRFRRRQRPRSCLTRRQHDLLLFQFTGRFLERVARTIMFLRVIGIIEATSMSAGSFTDYLTRQGQAIHPSMEIFRVVFDGNFLVT